jgi:hypothetical protein
METVPVPTLDDAITTLLADPADRVLARTIFGTDHAALIGERVCAHVRAELGSAIASCELFTQSVGAVFVLGLDDGRRVALKFHGPPSEALRSVDASGLRAVYAAQDELAARGVPCARVVSPPVACGPGFVAIMDALPARPADEPHLPGVRRALATLTANIAAHGVSLHGRDELPRSRLPSATVFQPPHNALFDFTRPGGEWIDGRARAARAVLDACENPVVMHSDISCANVRVTNGRVVAVYDMDSVSWVDEMRCLASIAVHFTYAGDPPWTLPSCDEARAFVDDYVAARGRPLTADERRRLDAAAIYAMAYTARCELGHDTTTTQMCTLLAAAPDAYLSG